MFLSIICMKMTLILNPLNSKVEEQTETLHKPIENVKELLETIKKFSDDLYLCCFLLIVVC